MKKWKILLCMIMIGISLFMVEAGQAKAKGTAEQQVTAIELPQNLNFYLDPENENGRGQIYSAKYMVRNAGKEAINFSIDMNLSLIADESSIVFCPEEWDADPVDRSVYMYVVFEGSQGENIHVLTDDEKSCTQTLVLEPRGQEGDAVYISFGGALSQSEDWKSGELVINALYSMSAKESEYKVKIDGDHIKFEEGQEGFITGEGGELYLVPEEGYVLPAKIQVYMNGQETEFSYDVVTGKVSLEKVTGDVIIYANGITKASLPDTEIIDAEKMLWSWEVEEGIQAYEYTFWQNDIAVDKGRINVENGLAEWNWSESLADGTYQLNLKAIGDNLHCLNSEEGSYSVIVNRELLQPSEDPGENEQEPSPSPESAEEDRTPPPSENLPSESPEGDNGEALQTPENAEGNEALPSPSEDIEIEDNGGEVIQQMEDIEEVPQLPENIEE